MPEPSRPDVNTGVGLLDSRSLPLKPPTGGSEPPSTAASPSTDSADHSEPVAVGTETGRLRRRIEDNPFLTILREQGVTFEVPRVFINQPQFAGQLRDSLTSLPIEDDNARQFLIDCLTECLRKKQGVAVQMTDLDNLKEKNSVSRDLGDLAIVNGTARATQGAISAIAEKPTTSLNTQSEPLPQRIVALRLKGAADEMLIFYFDVSPFDVRDIRREANLADASIQLTEPDIELSQTSVVMDLGDPEIAQELMTTLEHLKSDRGARASNLYREMLTILHNRSKDAKERKDNAKREDPVLFKSHTIAEQTEAATEKFGGKRVGKPNLEFALKLQTVQTLRIRALQIQNRGGNPDDLLHHYGLTFPEFEDFDNPEAIERLYTRISGDAE